MSTLTLTPIGLREAVWQGTILQKGEGHPQVQVLHDDRPVPDISLQAAGEGQWALKIPVPATAVADGIQTVVILDEADGTRLGHFTLMAGDDFSEDIRAEVELLRAELDMLKRAFRRHCVETG